MIPITFQSPLRQTGSNPSSGTMLRTPLSTITNKGEGFHTTSSSGLSSGAKRVPVKPTATSSTSSATKSTLSSHSNATTIQPKAATPNQSKQTSSSKTAGILSQKQEDNESRTENQSSNITSNILSTPKRHSTNNSNNNNNNYNNNNRSASASPSPSMSKTTSYLVMNTPIRASPSPVGLETIKTSNCRSCFTNNN